MKKFIEIILEDNRRRLVNIDWIEEIIEFDKNHCEIYLAFNQPNALEQDYIMALMSYDEIMKLLRGEDLCIIR